MVRKKKSWEIGKSVWRKKERVDMGKGLRKNVRKFVTDVRVRGGD